MSDFLEHKKIIDPAAWVARIPEKWRMPAMLGGPALLIILMTPLLFRDERAKPIDRNQVDSLAKTARQESAAYAQKEAALDAALARKLAADAPAPAMPAAALPPNMDQQKGPPPAAAAETTAPPQPDANASETSGAQAQAMDAPHLQGTQNAPTGSSGGSGSGPAAAAARAINAGNPLAANKPMAAAKLRPFNWSGPGKGSGGQLGNAVPQFGATVAATQGNGSNTPGTSAFASGASAYSTGGSGSSSNGGQQSHDPHGGASASANPSEGGGAGAAGAGANMSGLQAQMQQCQDAQKKYQPDIDSNQKAMQSDIKYRSDHNCKNIQCWNCDYSKLNDENDRHHYWRNYWCPCAHAHCDATWRCNNVKEDMQKEAKACPAGFSSGNTNMDCSMNGSH